MAKTATNNLPANNANPADAASNADKTADSTTNSATVPPPATETTPPAAPPSGDKSFTQSDLDAALAKEKKAWEKQVKDAEDRAKLSESERQKAETDDLRAQLRERDARDAVRTEAEKLGVKNPALAYKLVKDELEFDAKGKVSNLTEIFAAAKTDFPELFGGKPQASIDAGAGTNTNAPVLTKESLAKMTPSEINALDWSAVSKVLTEK